MIEEQQMLYLNTVHILSITKSKKKKKNLEIFLFLKVIMNWFDAPFNVIIISPCLYISISILVKVHVFNIIIK